MAKLLLDEDRDDVKEEVVVAVQSISVGDSATPEVFDDINGFSVTLLPGTDSIKLAVVRPSHSGRRFQAVFDSEDLANSGFGTLKSFDTSIALLRRALKGEDSLTATVAVESDDSEAVLLKVEVPSDDASEECTLRLPLAESSENEDMMHIKLETAIASNETMDQTDIKSHESKEQKEDSGHSLLIAAPTGMSVPLVRREDFRFNEEFAIGETQPKRFTVTSDGLKATANRGWFQILMQPSVSSGSHAVCVRIEELKGYFALGVTDDCDHRVCYGCAFWSDGVTFINDESLEPHCGGWQKGDTIKLTVHLESGRVQVDAPSGSHSVQWSPANRPVYFVFRAYYTGTALTILPPPPDAAAVDAKPTDCTCVLM